MAEADALLKNLGVVIQDIQKHSQKVAETWKELGIQLQHRHKGLLDVIADTLKLRGIAKEFATAWVKNNEDTEQLQKRALNVVIARTKFRALGDEQSRLELAHQRELMKVEVRRRALAEELHNFTGKKLAVEFLWIAAVREGLRANKELNEAIVNANSNFDKRFALTQQIFEVQTRTGTNMQEIAAASKALVAYWPKLRDDFAETLTTVTMMNQGLGVSNENAVQMARVFTISLNTSSRAVADNIAQIANSTSLAADEATRFAVEIGKALRVLGPGAAKGPAEVVKYVDMLAGRMQDVGGDASEIVKMFGEMTKGTPEAFMLRGLARVRTPGELGTPAGAEAAFKGMGRFINTIVNAAPGTAQYLAQLENASQITHLSTQELVLYQKMLQKANEPLDERTTLENRFREQMTASSKSAQMITAAFEGLIHRAITPLLELAAPFVNWLAKVVNKVTSSSVSVGLAMIGLGAGFIWTIKGVVRLTWALWLLQKQLRETAKAALAKALAGKTEGAEAAGDIFKTLAKNIPWLAKIGGALGGILGWVTRIGMSVLRFFVAGPGWIPLVGVAVGLAINRMFPAWTKAIGEQLYGIFHKQGVTQVQIQARRKTADQYAEEFKVAMLRGNMELADRIYLQGATHTEAILSKAAMEGYTEKLAKAGAQAREVIGMTGVTSGEAQMHKNDLVMINHLRTLADTALQRRDSAKKSEDRAAAAAEERRRREDQRAKEEQLRIRMSGPGIGSAPIKRELEH